MKFYADCRQKVRQLQDEERNGGATDECDQHIEDAGEDGEVDKCALLAHLIADDLAEPCADQTGDGARGDCGAEDDGILKDVLGEVCQQRHKEAYVHIVEDHGEEERDRGTGHCLQEAAGGIWFVS